MAGDLKANKIECEQPLPGDYLVPDPDFVISNGVSIAAPPSAVWPWLAQMGSGRGGWYAYDFVDNDRRPSAATVMKDLQDIHVGDILPSLPGASDSFVVARVEPDRDLVLTVPGGANGPGLSWEFFLEPRSPTGTRLLVRGRVSKGWPGAPASSPAPAEPKRPIEYVYAILDRIPRSIMVPIALAGHHVMQSRQLRGIRRRAEGTDREENRPRSAPPWSPWRARGPAAEPKRYADSPSAVTAIKVFHTLAWFSIESCMVYVLWAGLKGRTDRRVAMAAGVVAGESLIFAGSGFRCPLTELAERFGAERGNVTDIYLPRWFAHNIPAIHVPLIAVAIGLHTRNLLRRRPD